MHSAADVTAATAVTAAGVTSAMLRP